MSMTMERLEDYLGYLRMRLEVTKNDEEVYGYYQEKYRNLICATAQEEVLKNI